MKNLNLYTNDGLQVSYNLIDIKHIKYGKAKDFYQIDEIINNGLKPSDPMIIISFKNGTTASFGDNWAIDFD